MKKDQPIKIAYVLSQPLIYGAGRSVLNSIDSWNQGVLRPYLVVSGHGLLEQEFKRRGGKVLVMPELAGARGIGCLKVLGRLAAWFKAEKIQIVDYTFHHIVGVSIVFMAARFAGAKLVIRNRTLAPWLGLIDKFCVSRSEAVISVAGSILEKWQEKRRSDFWSRIEPAKVHVVADGRELETLRRMDGDPRFKEEFGIPSSAKLIGMVGSINPNKRQDIFIHAASEICRKTEDVSILIVGDANYDEAKNYEREIRKLAGDLGLEARVIFTGYRHDAHRIMKNLDVLVLASNVEGFPGVLIEAMALGVPVIASRAGGIPELVIHGVNGFLVLDQNPETYAGYIFKLLRNPAIRERFRIQAQKKLADYDLKVTTRREQEIYFHLLGRKPSIKKEALQPKVKAPQRKRKLEEVYAD